MSKKSRTKRKIKRANEKRARKQAMKAQYESWRDAGLTKDSKRARQQKKKSRKARRRSTHTHLPFPAHLYLDKKGKLKPGSPHRAYLELVRRDAALREIADEPPYHRHIMLDWMQKAA